MLTHILHGKSVSVGLKVFLTQVQESSLVEKLRVTLLDIR